MSNNWPKGVGRIVLPTTDSTLNEAARVFPTLTAPTWIIAHTQTAARGRRGRAWVNPEGNFAGTYVMPLSGSVETAALRSFVMALALFDAVVAVTGRAEALSLKWPNDVLLNGGKLAGILLESLTHGGKIAGLAIGVGVNLSQAPYPGDVEDHALRPVSLAGETGISVPPEEFLTILAAAYARREASFATFGFAPIREAWLARAARLGGVITARLPDTDVTGSFETLDENGYLILKTAKGPRAIAAADIYF